MDDLDGYFSCGWELTNTALRAIGSILIAIAVIITMLSGLLFQNAARKIRNIATFITTVLMIVALGVMLGSCYHDMNDISKSRKFCENDMEKTVDFLELPYDISCNYDYFMMYFILDVCALLFGIIALVFTLIKRASKSGASGSERDVLLIHEYDYNDDDDDYYGESAGEENYSFDSGRSEDDIFKVEDDEPKGGKKKKFWERKGKEEKEEENEESYDFENEGKFEYLPPSVPEEDKKQEKQEKQESSNPFEDDDPAQEGQPKEQEKEEEKSEEKSETSTQEPEEESK